MMNEKIHVDKYNRSIFGIRKMATVTMIDMTSYRKFRIPWTLKQKQEFIKSIMNGYPMNPIYLQYYFIDYLGMIDGGRRLQTILDFLFDRFYIKNESNQKIYFSDMSNIEKRIFEDFEIPVYLITTDDVTAKRLSKVLNRRFFI